VPLFCFLLGGKGLSVEYHHYTYDGLNLRNVIGKLKGTDDDCIVVVGSQLDTRPSDTNDGVSQAPGENVDLFDVFNFSTH